jgi:hypothetical protein
LGKGVTGVTCAIQEGGIKHLFESAENARGNDLARCFNALTMIIFFFRVNTMGAMEEEDDIDFDEFSGTSSSR